LVIDYIDGIGSSGIIGRLEHLFTVETINH